MKKSIFKDIYPVITYELSKSTLPQSSVDDIIEYLKIKVDSDPDATYISIFDHFSHTTSIGGNLMDGLLDAKNFIFCFGKAIPSTKALALRPKSIGICEFSDKFVIEYIEPPRVGAAEAVTKWLEELATAQKQPLTKETAENQINLN